MYIHTHFENTHTTELFLFLVGFVSLLWDFPDVCNVGGMMCECTCTNIRKKTHTRVLNVLVCLHPRALFVLVWGGFG